MPKFSGQNGDTASYSTGPPNQRHQYQTSGESSRDAGRNVNGSGNGIENGGGPSPGSNPQHRDPAQPLIAAQRSVSSVSRPGVVGVSDEVVVEGCDEAGNEADEDEEGEKEDNARKSSNPLIR